MEGIVKEQTLFHIKCTFCGGTNQSAEKCFKRIRQEKEKACAAGDSDNRRTEWIYRNVFNVDLKIT